jgi:chromosome segregation protein
VRGFLGAGGQDAPPAKLAFYSSPAAPAAEGAAGQPRLADLLRVHDAGLRAVLAGWLQGCYTAQSLDDALARRAQLQPGEVVYVASGHAVDAHSVSFYAQDSEQSGLLARAQEIEHLEKELRAQALIAEEARTALVRAEAAYADASQRLVAARNWPSRPARAARRSAPTCPRWRPSCPTCRSAAFPPRRASRSWTCSSPTARSATRSSATA